MSCGPATVCRVCKVQPKEDNHQEKFMPDQQQIQDPSGEISTIDGEVKRSYTLHPAFHDAYDPDGDLSLCIEPNAMDHQAALMGMYCC